MKDALIHQFVGLQLRLDYNMALKAFTTHLNISHIYELIFTKFIANHKNVLKGQVPRINSIKLTKKKMEKGVASTSSVPGMCEAVKRGTIVCCLFLFLFLVLLCFVMCGFFIFAFHMKRSLELGKYYFISSKAVLPLKTGIYTTKTLGHCRDR